MNRSPSSANEGQQQSPRARDEQRTVAGEGGAPAKGWKQVALGVKEEIRDDRLTLVAAGVAFYGFLALFPALAAVISIWGLFADPATVPQQIDQFAGALPASARDLLSQAATRIAQSASGSLGFGAAISLLLTLWSANKGMKGLVEGIVIAYDTDDRDRSFVQRNSLSLALTCGAIAMSLIAIGLVVALPPALGMLGLTGEMRTLVNIARWPVLAIFVIAALAVVYRVSPARKGPRWRWITPGAVVATLLWLAASLAFSYYTANFGSYNKTYGSMAAVAIMLMWFFISAFTVLLGAEINSEARKGRGTVQEERRR